MAFVAVYSLWALLEFAQLDASCTSIFTILYYTYASVLYEIKNGGNILVQMACMKVSITSKCLW